MGSAGTQHYLIAKRVSTIGPINFTVLPARPSWISTPYVVDSIGAARTQFREGERFGWSYAVTPVFYRWLHHFSISGGPSQTEQATSSYQPSGSYTYNQYDWGLPEGTYTFNIVIDGTDGPISYSQNVTILPYIDTEFVALPPSVPRDDSTWSTLKLTYAENGAPVPNRFVTFSSDRGSIDHFDNTSAVTDANGIATVRVKSGAHGTATISAYGPSHIADVDVTFTGPPVTTSFTANPNQLVANGIDQSALTLVYGDANQDPMRNLSIHFVSNRGGIDTFDPEYDTTDSEGNAASTVKSVTPGVATITAVDPNGNPIASTTVTFTGNGGGGGGFTMQLVADPPDVPADNATTSTITLLYAQNGLPVPNRTVTFRSSAGGTDTFNPPTATTNILGIASTTVRSGTPHAAQITVLDGGSTLPVSTTVNFYSIASSSLTATPNSVVADNVSFSTLRLTYLGPLGVPITNRTVTFTSSRPANDTFSSATATTNSQGVAVVTVRSNSPGLSTYRVSDGSDIGVSTSVDFQSIVKPLVGSVTCSYPGDGPFLKDVNLSDTINVTIADWKGQPGRIEVTVGGVTRTSPASGNSASITYDTGTVLQYSEAGTYNNVSIVAVNAAGDRSQPWVLHWLGKTLPDSLAKSRWTTGLGENPRLTLSSVPNGGFELKLLVEWPFDSPGKALIPGNQSLLRNLRWGQSIDKGTAEVTLTFSPITYPSYFIQGTGQVKIGGELGKKYGSYVSPKLGLGVAGQEWNVGLSGSGTFQFMPIWKLQNLTLQASGSGTWESANWLEKFFPNPWAIGLSRVFDLVVSGKLSGDLKVQYADGPSGFDFLPSDATAKFALSAILKDKPWVAAFVDVSAEIGIDPEMKLEYPGNATNAANFLGIKFLKEVSAGIFFKAKFKPKVPFLDVDYSYESKRVKYPGAGSRPAALASAKGTISQPNRSYLTNVVYHKINPVTKFPWQDRTHSKLEIGVDSIPDWDVEETQIVQNVFPSMSPSLAYKSGKAFIAYAYDRPGLPANQATEIRVLQETAGGWIDVDVTNDTALDAQPTILADQTGQLVIVWTRVENVALTDPAAVRMAKAEIVYSKFDAGTNAWGPVTPLTTNAVTDLNPHLGKLSNGALVLSWLRSQDNTFPVDPTDFDPPHTDIWVAQWDGSAFTNSQVAVSGANTTDAVSVTGTPTRLDLAYSRDLDGNKTTEDSAVFYQSGWFGSWANPVQVLVDPAPQFGANVAVGTDGLPTVYFGRKSAGGDDLVWRKSGGAPKTYSTLKSISNLQLLRRAGGEVWLEWASSSEDTADLWTLSIDGSGSRIGVPIRLTKDAPSEREVAVALTNDGFPSAAYVKMNVDQQPRTIDDGGVPATIMATVPTTHDLFKLIHRPTPDLVLTADDITFTPAVPVPGSSLQVAVNARNARSTRISPKIAIYDGDPANGGTQLGVKATSPATFAAGEAVTATFTVTVPNDGNAHLLFAKVDPDLQITETSESNNVAYRPLLATDLAADGPALQSWNGSIANLAMAIRNDSTVGVVGNVHWQLWRGSVGSGTLVTEGDAQAPAPGGVRTILYPWQTSGLAAGTYPLTFAVDPGVQIADSDRGNNKSGGSVTITGVSAIDLNPASVTGGDDVVGTVTLSMPAPTGGAVVTLSSSKPAVASVPGSVTVPADSSTAQFTVTTTAISATTTATITGANSGYSASQTLTVKRPYLQSLTSETGSNYVHSGNTLGIRATMTGKTPAGGWVVQLTSANPSVASVPTNVTVVGGTTSAVFQATTYAVQTSTPVTITGSAGVAKAITIVVTTAQTLTIASSPLSGLAVGATLDLNNNGAGVTTFTRTYEGGTSVALSSPAQVTQGGVRYLYDHREKDGVPTTAPLVMDADQTATLVYVPGYVLTVQSAPTGVPIKVWTKDYYNRNDGTTQFTRTYKTGVTASLTAPVTTGTKAFDHWEKNGVPVGTARTINVPMTADTTVKAVYKDAFTLTFTAGNATAVPITVYQADVNSLKNGTTDFTRLYLTGSSVSFTAPQVVGTKYFARWEKNGLVLSTSATVTVSVTNNATYKAVYNDGVVLTVNSETPSSGVPITMWTRDRAGQANGTTSFTRLYALGQTVSMTAPASMNGKAFVCWKIDGTVQAGPSRTITVTMSAAKTCTAVYSP